MLRNWAAKFNKSLSKRASSRRLEKSVPIKLTVEPDKNTGRLQTPFEELSVVGETVDFSRTGVAFLVSCIRLKEFYLVGEGRVLKAEITLPNGRVTMRLVGRRYEQTGQHLSVTKYIIGAQIVEISEEDNERYLDFLGRKPTHSGALKLEGEES